MGGSKVCSKLAIIPMAHDRDPKSRCKVNGDDPTSSREGVQGRGLSSSTAYPGLGRLIAKYPGSTKCDEANDGQGYRGWREHGGTRLSSERADRGMMKSKTNKQEPPRSNGDNMKERAIDQSWIAG